MDELTEHNIHCDAACGCEWADVAAGRMRRCDLCDEPAPAYEPVCDACAARK